MVADVPVRPVGESDPLSSVFRKFVNAPTTQLACQVLRENSELLTSSEVKDFFSASLEGNAGNRLAQRVLTARWDLLGHCAPRKQEG